MSKRPILIVTVSYIMGILWGLYLEISIVPFAVCGFIVSYIVLKYFLHKTSILKFIILILVTLTISSIIVQYKEKQFKTVFYNIPEEAVYVGIVESQEKESEYYHNYVVKVKNESEEDVFKNKCILLKVKKSKANTHKLLEYGDEILVKGKMELPATRRNYKGYDYRQYLKTKGVYAICVSNSNNLKLVAKNKHFVINMWINKFKNMLKKNTTQMLSPQSAGIAMALFLGDSDLVNDNQKEMFSNASLSHVLAISGMHVTYVFIGISWLLKKFDKRKSKYIFICFLIFFAELTGGSPSIVRATIMSVLMISSKLVYRKSDVINNLGISCLIILICNPYNILNLGFQLSFLGTLGIVLFNKRITSFWDGIFGKVVTTSLVNRTFGDITTTILEDRLLGNADGKAKRNKIIHSVKSLIITSISANILIFPILIYVFNTFSLTFLFSNIIITPILGVLFLVGYITIIMSLISTKISIPFSACLNFLLSIFNKIGEFSANITFTRSVVTTPSLITVLMYYVIVIFVFGKVKKKVIAVISVIVIVSHFIPNYGDGLKLFFIDVGQGDSTLIITKYNKTILIDGGGSENGDYDVGKKVLVPYLLDRKIKTIDYMIFSHFDSDHCKGLFSVIENLEVRNVVISKQEKISENYRCFVELVNNKKLNVILVKAGNRIKIDKSTYIDIMWPNDELIGENVLNNNSIVCKLNYGESSVLFTGDIEEVAEKEIVRAYGKDKLNANVLKVAHHGSKSSSIEEFVRSVEPKVALIGVGEKNNFGHPNRGVIGRLKNVGAMVCRTDLMGEVVLVMDGDNRTELLIYHF